MQQGPDYFIKKYEKSSVLDLYPFHNPSDADNECTILF